VPFVFRVSGTIYLSIATLVTMGAIIMVTRFYRSRELTTARQFFRYMLIYLPVLFVSMAANRMDF